jgi:uncharacterized delta-60 repeat protein
MKMFLKTINFIVISINFLFAISFAKIYGGGDDDAASSIYETPDGGYIVAGFTNSFGAGDGDILVIKLNSTGNIQWAKTFNAGLWDCVFSFQQTNDGGYIMAGSTYPDNMSDFLIIKLTSQWDVQWAKTFGGIYDDWVCSIEQTNDGGYIIIGETYSFGGGDGAILIIKLNSQGDVVWAKTYSGGVYEYAPSIEQTNDGGYIVVGETYSFGAGEGDVLVIKLDSQGEIEWIKTFGGIYDDGAHFIYQTNDGGYIIAGSTNSFGAGYSDFLIIKLNLQGEIEWVKTFGGSESDWAFRIEQTNDGGYIVGGVTESFGLGWSDFLIIKLNPQAEIEWAKTFGGGYEDWLSSIHKTNDGGYVIVGSTSSFGGGYSNFLVVKTQDGQMASDCPWYDCSPTVTSPNLSVDFPSINITSPNLTITSPPISTSSPTVLTSNVCSPSVEEIYFSKENIKLFSSTFLKDKISLIFSGYSKEKIKIILYDVLGNEIISKTFDFNNYIEIKDKRIEKIKKGIYFLKIYLKGKEIGSLKMIK